MPFQVSPSFGGPHFFFFFFFCVPLHSLICNHKLSLFNRYECQPCTRRDLCMLATADSTGRVGLPGCSCGKAVRLQPHRDSTWSV